MTTPVCRTCGKANPAGNKFCGECGAALPHGSAVEGSHPFREPG
jgi:predicted nucleic acid-binding Zn ribbon protein